MKYDFYTLSLLSSLEVYLPYMTEEEIADILRYGVAPSPWQIREWESMRERDGGRVEKAIKTAISRQK